MKTLILAYDNQDFKEALIEAQHACIVTELETLIEYASHDLNKGFCESYQIYLNNGVLIFDSNQFKAA